ncbi:hypothetical protein ASG82_16565 [Mycobacterium sp. Soil538]|nr:hypothetical protein ASG82_16565 [Mycobacterium sp. Soil538]
MNARTRFLVLPLLTAGILGGALGVARTAAAQTTTGNHNGHVATTPRDTRSHMPTHFRVFGERHASRLGR